MFFEPVLVYILGPQPGIQLNGGIIAAIAIGISAVIATVVIAFYVIARKCGKFIFCIWEFVCFFIIAHLVYISTTLLFMEAHFGH